MDTQIVATFCLCDDMLKAFHHHDDPQCQISDAEIMTIALTACFFLGGNYTRARLLMYEQGYVRKLLSKSRFSRRLHRLKPFFLVLFKLLSEYWKQQNEDQVYAIDTFPVLVCDNYRIPRAKLYREEAFRGYQASKKRFYYGLKIHMLATEAGHPVEFFLSPASMHDVKGLQYFDFDLPPNSRVVGDKAYNDYQMEDVLWEADIELMPMRKKNSKRSVPPWMRYLQYRYRRMIETTGSLFNQLLPKKIHATSALGFELKVVLFVVACSINMLFTGMVAT
jgi:hypothetical protein